MAHFDAEFGNDVIDKADGRAEQAAAGNHVVARLQEGEKRRLNRGHAGRSGDRAFRTFQSGDAFFKGRNGRVGSTGISEPFDFF